MIKLILLLLPLAAVAPEIAKLAWMSGCWALDRNGTRVEEHWSSPAGGVMLGYSRTIRPSRPTSFEQIRIEAKEGELLYVPIVGKQGPIPFTLVKSSEQEVVFENPKHDYPQRIAYKRLGDELHARTELLDEAKPRTQSFPYKRVTCD